MKAVKLIKLLQAGVAAMGEDVYVDLTGGEVRFMQYIRHELPSIPVRSTKADVQQWTVERLAYYGLNVISGCRAKLTLRTPQLEEIQVVSYFALSDKSKGKKPASPYRGLTIQPIVGCCLRLSLGVEFTSGVEKRLSRTLGKRH